MANEDTADSAQPKSKKGIIIVIVVVLNVLLIGGVMFFMMSYQSGGKDDGVSEQKQVRQGRGQQRSGPMDGPLIEMDGFVVNLTNAREKKYLKTRLSVQLFSPEDEAEFNKNQAIVRNEVLLQLSAVDMEKVQTIEGKRDLEKMLVQKVNGRLDMDRIAHIYFTEFVTQ